MSTSNPIYGKPSVDPEIFEGNVRQVITVLKETGETVQLDLISFADIIWAVQQRIPDLSAHVKDLDRQLSRILERLAVVESERNERLRLFLAGAPVPATEDHMASCADHHCPCVGA